MIFQSMQAGDDASLKMSAYDSMRKAGVNYTKPGGTAGNEIILSQQRILCWDRIISFPAVPPGLV